MSMLQHTKDGVTWIRNKLSADGSVWGLKTALYLLLQQLIVNEPGLTVGEGASWWSVKVEGGEDLRKVLKLPAVMRQKLVQACTHRERGTKGLE